MLTTTITRPPFTYTTFSFLLLNLILEKLLSVAWCWKQQNFLSFEFLGFRNTHTHTHKVWLQYKIYTRAHNVDCSIVSLLVQFVAVIVRSISLFCPMSITIPSNVHRLFVWCLLSFRPMSVVIPFDVCCRFIQRLSQFFPTSVTVTSDVRHSIQLSSSSVCLFGSFHPPMFVHRHSSPSTYRILQTINCVRIL